MSFSSLWDQAESVCRHAAVRREGLQDLITLLKGRADLELRYAKGMERLGNHSNCVSDYGTLGNGISALKSNWINQAVHAKTLTDAINREVVEPLQHMALSQIQPIKTQTQICRRTTRLLKEKIERCERTKLRYDRASMETEQLAVGFEEVKELGEERRAKAVDRLFESKRELDVCLETYIAALEDYNNNRVPLQDQLEQQLLSFQVQEGQRLDAIKSALAQLNGLEFARVSGLKFDLRNLVPAIGSIHPLSDIQVYVSSVGSYTTPPEAKAFDAYNGTHPLFRSAAFPLLFHRDDWMDYLLSSQSSIRRPEIDILMHKITTGEAITEVELTQFRAILMEENGVRAWTQCLNRRRFESQFEVRQDSFEQLGKMLEISLETCLHTGDARGIRNIIILSHTFYSSNTSPKLYLQSAILSNPCWKDISFWQTLLKDQIDMEFEQFAELCMNEEQVSDTQSRIKNIVFAQLSSFAHIMQAFDFVTVEAGALLKEYTQRFLLPYEESQAVLVRG